MDTTTTAVQDWLAEIRAAQAWYRQQKQDRAEARRAEETALARTAGAKLERALRYFGIDASSEGDNSVPLVIDGRTYYVSLARTVSYLKHDVVFEAHVYANDTIYYRFTLIVERYLPDDLTHDDGADSIAQDVDVSTTVTAVAVEPDDARRADLARLGNVFDEIDERWEREVAYRRMVRAAPPTPKHEPSDAEQLIALIRRLCRRDEE